MAKKTTALTEDTAPLAADLIATVDDPGGTPISKKAQISNIVGYMVTTAGDIIYATGSRVLARLGIGTAGQLLATNSGTTAPEWVGPGGKQTIFIPAAAMKPTVSNGCANLTAVETTAARPDMIVLDFGNGADEHAQFQVAFPKSWNEGTVTYQVFWTSTAADTDGVAWALQGVAVTDGGTIDVAYGTAVVVTDDAQGTAEDLYVTAESAAVTIAGTPAEADMCFFRIFRDVSDGNDDMAEDARLIGVKLHFTTNAREDT
jgi:hypothetical protein